LDVVELGKSLWDLCRETAKSDKRGCPDFQSCHKNSSQAKLVVTPTLSMPIWVVEGFPVPCNVILGGILQALKIYKSCASWTALLGRSLWVWCLTHVVSQRAG
jgi:hypothetical protein